MRMIELDIATAYFADKLKNKSSNGTRINPPPTPEAEAKFATPKMSKNPMNSKSSIGNIFLCLHSPSLQTI